MATSGEYTWTPSSYGPGVGYPNRAKIVWSATWNMASLQWTVTWNATAQGASTAGRWTTVYGSNNGCNSYITVTDENGNVLQTKTIVAKMDTVKNDTVLLEGTFNVGVTSLGTRSLTFAGQIYFETTGNAGISSGSQAFALDTVALASSISSVSPSNVSVTSSGGVSTVNIASNSSAYTHRVWWYFGSRSAYVDVGAGVSSASYTIPAAWLDQIPSSATGQGGVTLTTYYNGTQIGDTTPMTPFYVTANVYPTIGSFTSAPRGAAYDAQITNYTTVYVSGYSTALLSASSCSGVYGSSIKYYEFLQGGALIARYDTSASAYSHTTGNLSGTSVTLSVRVTDTRDRQATANVTVTLKAYATPSFSAASAYRCNSSGTAQNDGTYVKVEATAVATPSENSIVSLTFAEKPTTSSTWSSEYAVANYPITSGYANTASYDVRIKATDKLGQSSYRYFTIPTAEYTMDFKVGGKGVAFGKVAEQDNLVDSAWNIQTQGNVRAVGSGYFGNGSESGTQIQLQNTTGSSFLHRNGANRGIYDSAGGWEIGCDGTYVWSDFPPRNLIAPTLYTITTGYFVVSYAYATANSVIFAQPMYASAVGAVRWIFTTSTYTNGQFIVYVRDANGNLPPDNTQVYVAFLVI